MVPGIRVAADYLRQAATAAASLKTTSHEALDLGPAARVLDLGCGPGLDVRALAREGRLVVGADHDADLLTQARSDVPPQSGFVRADAAALPFASGSFDAARAERLLQHVPDPAAVVAEMTRVTRGGGRVVLVDTDWASLSISGGSLEPERRVVAALLQQVARHPTAGRDLPFHVAGLPLDVLSVTVHPLTSGDLGTVRAMAHLDLAERHALDSGSIGRDELERWRAGLAAAARRGTLLATVDLVMLVGRRRDA
jgi:SAM-dependent methyltransferase